MSGFLNKIKILLTKVGFFKENFKKPVKLPQGLTEFEVWASSIINKYDLPNNDSVRFMLATMIMYAKEDAAYLSKEYFGLRAVKSAANEVAAYIVHDLKGKQQAALKAAQEASESQNTNGVTT